jgi:hypothetical protein
MEGKVNISPDPLVHHARILAGSGGRRSRARPSGPLRALDRSRLASGQKILRAMDADASGGGSGHGYSLQAKKPKDKAPLPP